MWGVYGEIKNINGFLKKYWERVLCGPRVSVPIYKNHMCSTRLFKGVHKTAINFGKQMNVVVVFILLLDFLSKAFECCLMLGLQVHSFCFSN